MTFEEYLANYVPRIDSQIERCRAALDGLDVDQWNAPLKNPWTLAQILEHMHISAAPYVISIDEALSSATPGEGQLKFTFLGKMILQGAGPNGNVPAPKAMEPPKGPFDKLVRERYETGYRRLQDLARKSRGMDLNKSKLPIPIMPRFKISLGDAFEIMSAHAERHVGQIETFSKALRG